MKNISLFLKCIAVLTVICILLTGCALLKERELFDDHDEFLKQVRGSLRVPDGENITYTISEPRYDSEYKDKIVTVIFLENGKKVAQAECLTKNGALVGAIKTYSEATENDVPVQPRSETETKPQSEPPVQKNSSSDGYLKYNNVRFGYTVYYPADFNAGPEAENGDGRIFTSDDREFEIRCWGSHGPMAVMPDNWSLDTYYDYVLRELDYVPTYKHKDKAKSFFVFSGYKGENIIYDKYIIKSDGTENVIRITYPTAKRATFDDKVTYISHNFFSGSGASSPAVR